MILLNQVPDYLSSCIISVMVNLAIDYSDIDQSAIVD